MEFISFDPISKSLALKQAPIPKPAPDEVIIKVAYSGICGTDLHIIEGSFPCKQDGPVTLGHEFCGTITGLGSAVNTFKIGQRVAVDPNNGCNKCNYCHNGHYNHCPTGAINNTIGIFRNGGWATHVVVPETQVFLIPDGVELYQAALSEPLSCLAHGWDKISSTPVGANVLIMGAGIIGLLWSCLLHLRGFRNTVTVSELNENRKKMVTNIGLGYDVKSPTELKDKTFDLIVDCSGSCQAMEAAMSLLAPGGCLCIFGVASPTGKMSIKPFEMYKKELKIVGVNINPFTFPKGLGLLQAMCDKYLRYEKLGIKEYKLSEYQRALEALRKGDISKAVFKI